MPEADGPQRPDWLSAAVQPRRAYLDWLRGIAVLLMMESHILDSWTRAPDRESAAYAQALIVGGMGTALFLLLAGVAASLSAGSKSRRSGNPAAASIAVVRRRIEVFALALLFRIQAWVLGWSSNPYDLLKVDILDIMGPSIAAAAMLWRLTGSVRGRCATFAVASLATVFITPVVRTLPFGFLPDPLEAYDRLRPPHGLDARLLDCENPGRQSGAGAETETEGRRMTS